MLSVAQAASIKSIEVYGLNAIARGTVLSYLPVEVGDDYNNKISAQIIRSLYQTGFFKDVDVEQENQILKIVIKENPHIKYIDLLNYTDKVLDKERIDEILQNMELTQGKIFNKKRLNQLINQLEATYIAKGYYSAKIDKSIKIDDKNRVEIELDIYEGEVARIDNMKISGNVIYDEDDLLELFEIGEADFFVLNYFTKKNHYSKIALDAGIEALKSFYTNLGYLDFKINKVDTNLTNNKQKISIDIQVQEGARYNVGNIQFTGDLLNQSIQNLEKIFAMKKGDVFERKQVVKGIRAVSNVFIDQGYAFAQIDPITSENSTAHTIDLNINIQLNKKVYINRITISGNTRTQDDVIRREISIAEGGVYSSTELDKSLNKIRRLGFFSSVNMEVSKVKNFEDKINLHFSVEEAKTGQFSIGLSHSNDSGVSFNLGIQENNFLGTGRVLNANLSTSEAVQEASFFFSDPYFTTGKHSISYGVFSKNTDGEALDLSEYKIGEIGGSIGYGFPITENTRINTGIRVSKRDITCGYELAGTNGPLEGGTPTATTADPDDFTNNGLETAQCASDDDFEVKFSAGLSNNTLNNFRFPTAGQQNSLGFEVALPFGDFNYYKVNAAHKSYYPLSKKLTLGAKANIGLASGYNDKELPFFERYYGGGSSSIRGFDFNSLGAAYANGDAKGGELSLLVSTSIISKLGFAGKKAENMRVSAFIDAGSITEEFSDFELDDARASAGIAFTWITPVGPIGIYAATPLLKKDGDKTKNVEFTLGTSF